MRLRIESLVLFGDPNFGLRAPELAWTLVLDVVKLHPYWASIATCFNDLVRAFAKRPKIQESILRIIRLRSEGGAGQSPIGPVANAIKAAKMLGYSLETDATLRGSAGQRDIPLTGQDPRWIAQQVNNVIV